MLTHLDGYVFETAICSVFQRITSFSKGVEVTTIPVYVPL